jgi:diguanylate cyclase (GGDEF)-like protein
MKKPLGRAKLVVIGLVCIICIISYLFIFRPMENALKKSKQQEFIYSAEAVGYAAEIFMTNCINDVRKLSNKTELKQKIRAYKAGNITLDDIKEYTLLAYEDEYDALEYVVGAFRIFEGGVIASKGSVDPVSLDWKPAFRDIASIIDPDSLSVTVYSPIKNNEEILGYDVAVFDISEVLENVHQGHMIHEIYSKGDVEKYLPNNNWTELKEGEYLAAGETETWYIKHLKNTDVYFIASSPNEIIYRTINTFLGGLLFYFPLTILISIAIIGIYTFGNIGRRIKGLESERDRYRKEAQMDGLTGTFSRNYFNEYLENNGFSLFHWPLAVAMIDVNNFKTINDTYGHSIGDDVLQEIAAVLKSSVRDTDMVVRYGGDEFILLLRDCSIENAEEILERTVEKIRNIDKYDFNIEISYGVVEVANKEELLSGIQQADLKMYQMKRKMSIS